MTKSSQVVFAIEWIFQHGRIGMVQMGEAEGENVIFLNAMGTRSQTLASARLDARMRIRQNQQLNRVSKQRGKSAAGSKSGLALIFVGGFRKLDFSITYTYHDRTISVASSKTACR